MHAHASRAQYKPRLLRLCCLGVQVAANPQGGLTEDDCLKQFEKAADFPQLRAAGGGFGVNHLFKKLVQLQEDMVKVMDQTCCIAEVRAYSTSQH